METQEKTLLELKKIVVKYANEVNKLYKLGNIESSFNKPVIDLLNAFNCFALDFSGGRKENAGENVDIKLWHTEEEIDKIEPFGAIEVKKVNGIDKRAQSQILTEAQKYGNVILTDNITWKFYHAENESMYNGFRLMKLENGEFVLDESKIELFITSLKDFVLAKPTNIKSSNKLAYYMAQYAQTIKVTVFNILQAGSQKIMFNELFALYSRLKKELLPELSLEEFSDMYAQTIVYGLFIARYNDLTPETFTRGEAIENLSKESHLLKQFFQHITTSSNLHPTLNENIENLCKLFSITDLKDLLDQYEKKDAIVHFYEDFLTFYDIEKKRKFGAYYTPVEVVDYMVKKVDEILVNDFSIKGGLANNDTIKIKVKCDEYVVGKTRKTEKDIDVPRVAILDPACGTGTFGAEIIKYIKDKYFSGSNEIFYKDWMQKENGLMSRLICFEIMMTSYVIAHLKIRRTILDTLKGQNIDKNLTSNIFLTNTLSEPKSVVERNNQFSMFDFSGAITDEAENADKWKARRPIQVIIGNPPYLAASTNPYDISAYKFETDGKTKLNEKNPKWLNDDYVKFIRFAEQHIQYDGKGVLAFITNNGYLDNPTFRGMRASLLRTFDKIYILNLHGNTRKKESTPSGSKDENVFNIMVGTAIIFGIKTTQNNNWAKVYYADLYGTRENKLKLLENGQINYSEIVIDKKYANFVPQKDLSVKCEYDNGVDLTKLFNLYSAGVVTGRDNLTICESKKEIEDIVKDFQNRDFDYIKNKYNTGRDTDWTVGGAIKDVQESKGYYTQIAYRIFDNRWTYYTGKQNGFYCRPRSEVMNNLIHVQRDNPALIITRNDFSSREFSNIFVSKNIVDAHITAAPTISTVIPLYVGLDGEFGSMSNINFQSYTELIQNLSTRPKPQEIFDYCYGVLFDTNYRKKFNEFLKSDYPKVPVAENDEQFEKYKNAGAYLRQLHLMELDVSKELRLDVDETRNLLIDKISFNDGTLKINNDTAIYGISNEAWSYFIGGYQVIDKWLKSHKGEILDIEKFNHLKKVVGVIEETIKLQKEL